MDRSYQLLSIQRSFLGNVRPDLRAVIIDHSIKNSFHVKVILDHEPTEDDHDFYSAALAEFCANISFNQETKYQEEIIFSNQDFKYLISEGQSFAFMRYEPSLGY